MVFVFYKPFPSLLWRLASSRDEYLPRLSPVALQGGKSGASQGRKPTAPDGSKPGLLNRAVDSIASKMAFFVSFGASSLSKTQLL